MKTLKAENNLLATHISDNSDFETACLTGDAIKIRSIVITEMEKANLHTKGSNKLRDDIFSMLQGKDKVSTYIGNNILSFVWNSRLSGTGFAVTY
jgi:hypothetical protein